MKTNTNHNYSCVHFESNSSPIGHQIHQKMSLVSQLNKRIKL